MAVEGLEFERAFRGAIQYTLNSGFSVAKLQNTRPLTPSLNLLLPRSAVDVIYIINLKSNEDMILALAGQFKQLSHEPEKFR